MNYIARILGIIYPIKCVECGRIGNKYLCIRCRARLGMKIETHFERYKNKNFKKHIYLFKYDGWIRERIIKYKFRNNAYLYRLFLELIIETNNENNLFNNYDYIIPVPISKKRKKERGYNQSELMAKGITKQINNISLARIIDKKIDNKAQSTLNQKERESNVKGAYVVNEKEIAKFKDIVNKKILLIDDIFTTGNTVNEAARVLRYYGIKSIDIFTIAKD